MRRPLYPKLLPVLLTLLGIALSADAAIEIENLRCEYLRNPVGIHELKPRLSWEITSLERGEKQTAWQVMVASTAEKLAADDADLWNSGKVMGDATSHIVYAGTPLVSRSACFWKVKAWDKDGQSDGWSEPASWSVGLTDPAEWKAHWIDGRRFGHASLPANPPVITGAFYETVNGSVSWDVTQRFAGIAPGHNFTLKVTNDTFGGDPLLNTAKRLRIQYTQGGNSLTRNFAENATVSSRDLLTVSPTILEARYISGGSFRDATAKLVSLAAGGPFSLVVNDANLGPDPAPGQPKSLWVKYSVDGITGGATFPFNSTFQYPSGLPEPVGVEITGATYEAIDGAGFLDVKAKLATFGQAYTITVNNGTFGSDPAFEHRKRLRIDYIRDGKPWVKLVKENTGFSYPGDLAEPTTVPLLRKSFGVSKPVRKATMYATALGLYELRLNGTRVGDHILAPEWTDYNKRLNYQAYDVTSQVVSGPNAIGAQVADGWYSGNIGNGGFRYWGVNPAMKAQLEIDYQDGTRDTIVSDGSWKVGNGPILSTDFMFGEMRDSRADVAGWDTPGFNDSGWLTSLVRIEAPRPLGGQVTEPVRNLMELPALSVSQPSPGRWVYDMGQNMVGVVRLKVSQNPGTRILIRHAEMLNPDGTMYVTNLRGAPSIDTYVCKGGGQETWTPTFAFHGFRYVEISGVTTPPALDAITGVVFATDTRGTGSFSSSDGRLNQLQSNIEWGQRGNYLSVPTDCPQRDERLGWMGDAQVFVQTAAYNSDIAAFFTKWMADVRDGQHSSGAYSNVVPVTFQEYGSPAWADAGVICPWAIYQAYGDTRILEENYTAMAKWIQWCGANSTNSIRDRARGGDFGDWLSIGANTDKELIGTAYYGYSTALMAKIATALGKTADAQQYETLFQTIKTAFINKYVNQTTGAVTSNTQCAYAMALAFDLLPENVRPKTALLLKNDIAAKGTHLSTGFVGVSYLLPVLSKAGMTDTAYDLLLQDTFPSWLFSVKHGATTIWERWDGWTPENGFQDPGMNSFNHYSLGSCGEWLYRTAAGIGADPAVPGYRKITIRPETGTRLSSVQAKFHSIRGPVSSAWRKYEGGFVMQVEIPANSTAEVHVPAADAASVRESSKPVAEAEGVAFLRMENGAAVFAVQSGRYRFTTGTGEPGVDTVYHDPGVPLKIRVSSLLANDGPGPLELVSAGPLSVNGGTITIEDGWIYYTPLPGSAGPDSFTYVVRDAQGGLSTRTVIVGIIPEDAPVQYPTSVEMRSDGALEVWFSGVPGRRYRIESSETLEGSQAWGERTSVAAGEDGSFHFLDPAPLPSKRFYRAGYP